MEWTAIENATVGTVIAMALLIIWKFLGQRTDPKLLELVDTMTTANAQREAGRDNTAERLAKALDRNTETVSIVAESIRQIVLTITTEHAQQFAAIGNIPSTILPAINILTEQIEAQKGSVRQMDTKVEDQTGAIQQILAAVLRLEARVETIGSNFDTFQTESIKLGVEIQDTKQELIAIKSDVKNLKPVPKSSQEFVLRKRSDAEQGEYLKEKRIERIKKQEQDITDNDEAEKEVTNE